MALTMFNLALLFLVQSIHMIPVTIATAARPPRVPPTTAPVLLRLVDEEFEVADEFVVIKGLFKALNQLISKR